jgi:hypothetical protein
VKPHESFDHTGPFEEVEEKRQELLGRIDERAALNDA